jgi:uncharacterized protein involved in high-affinity Fe2+ transport
MAKNSKSKALVPAVLAALPAQTIELKEIPIVNPNNVQSVYTNAVTVMNGQFDIRLLFNEIVMEGIGKPVESILRANVTMTPAHAKAFVEALANALEQYPDTFGEIPWPPKKIG